MTELYQEEQLTAVRNQLKKRLTVIGIICAALIAVLIYSFIVRTEALSVAAAVLTGAVLIAGLGLFCKPIYRYQKLIQSALKGRHHTDVFEFDHLEPDDSEVDGVSCRSLVFLGEPDKHGTRETMFYWDKEIPLPAFREGEQVELRYTGKNITGYRIAG